MIKKIVFSFLALFTLVNPVSASFFDPSVISGNQTNPINFTWYYDEVNTSDYSFGFKFYDINDNVLYQNQCSAQGVQEVVFNNSIPLGSYEKISVFFLNSPNCFDGNIMDNMISSFTVSRAGSVIFPPLTPMGLLNAIGEVVYDVYNSALPYLFIIMGVLLALWIINFLISIIPKDKNK